MLTRTSSTEHTCKKMKPRFGDINPVHVLPQRLRPRNNQNNFAHLTTIEAEEDPKRYKEAMRRADSEKWQQAMQEEIDSLMKNEVWELVDRPKQNIVTNRWVLKIKRKPDGQIERYKARLVARGFSQKYGIDYLETYAPVVNMASIRMLFAYAATNGMHLSQFDVKTAFLYGDLDEEVFMEQPEGFSEENGKVCRLKRSLYGLKQSPRQWNKKFTQFLQDMDLQTSQNDGCIFYRNDRTLIVAIYVDDGLILASNENDIVEVMTALEDRFEVHSVKATTFLGFQIEQKGPNEILLHQDSYINTILKRFNMIDAKPVDAPITTSKLSKDDGPLDETVPYREAIGSLMYAAITTRIDIAYAVNKASRAVEKPTKSDWIAVKRIFRYLKGKEDYGITYKKDSTGIVAYCDSDFAGDEDTGRSTTGLVIMYAGGPVHWKSQRQKLITLSSTEAEFVSICSTIKEVVWHRKLALELDMITEEPTTVYCDNQSAIRIASNEKCVHRTRHMKVQASYPREQMELGEVDIKHIRTDKQLADMLTKPMSIQKFKTNNSQLMNSLSMMLTLLCMVALISQSSGYIFDRVSPLMTEVTDYKVDGGTNEYEVDFVYVNPCEAIANLTNQQTLDILKQLDETEYEHLREDCQKAYESEWVTAVEDLISTKRAVDHSQTRIISKRAIPVILGTGLLFYAVTNLVVSLFGIKYVPKYSEQQIEVEAGQLRKFERQLLATRTIQEGIINTTESLANKLKEQEQAVERLTILLPAIAWKSTQLYSSISKAAANLKSIKQHYVYNRLNTFAVRELWNTTEFDLLKPEDTLLEEVKRISNRTITFRFVAKKPAEGAKVYKLIAFDKWENLTDVPQLLVYDGPKYLVHNETSKCSRGIETPDPKTSWILEECNDWNSTDPRLDIWTKKDVLSEKNTLPKIVKSLKYNYISCYKHSITLPEGTFECPPYPFKLTHDIPFSTVGHNYAPKSIKYEFRVGKPANYDDSSRLLKSTSKDETNENTMLKAIRELKAASKASKEEIDSSIVIARYGTTWWIGFALSAFTTLVTILHIYTWFRTHVVQVKREREADMSLNHIHKVEAPEYTDGQHLYPNHCRACATNRDP